MSIEIIEAATSRQLTTVANVRGDLGISAEAVSDQQLTRFIAQASETAARFCRRSFGVERVRERFLGSRRGMEIVFSRGPVTAVHAVTAGGHTLLAEDYALGQGALLRRSNGLTYGLWDAWWAGVLVEYSAGYRLPGDADPTLPADLERAVILLVGSLISGRNRDVMVKSERVEGIGQTDFYVQGANARLPHPEAEAILATYKVGGLS